MSCPAETSMHLITTLPNVRNTDLVSPLDFAYCQASRSCHADTLVHDEAVHIKKEEFRVQG